MAAELFRKNRVSTAQARMLFHVMEWLVKRHGRPIAPQVQSPLQKAHRTILDSRWIPLKAQAEAEARSGSGSISTWAEHQFLELKQAAGMGHWPVQITPVTSEKFNHAHLYKTANWNPAAQEPYYIDQYGRAIIPFERESCAIAGAFDSHILMKLAAMRLVSFSTDAPVNLEMGAMMTLASAAFSGQGFYLLPMAEQITQDLSSKPSAKLSKDSLENGLIFNSCLGLLSLNRTPEHIIATYGNTMCPILRQKIRSACRQIEHMPSELLRLKQSVNPKRKTHLPLPWKCANKAQNKTLRAT